MKHYMFNPDAKPKSHATEISADELTVLRAMYHKTRKEWLEWYGHELAKKTGLDHFTVTACLTSLANRGMVKTRPGPRGVANVASWRATDLGQGLKP